MPNFVMRPISDLKLNLRQAVTTMTLVVSLFFTANLSAVEINPSDTVDPVEHAPAFEAIGATNQLVQDKANNNLSGNLKKQTWWGWLTNTSRKPANFHYIDFIELLQ